MTGPPPKPTALKILDGNPGKRPLNKREPRPPEFCTDPPDHLDEIGVKEWHRLVPILKQMRILTDADYIALGQLCQAFSTCIKAQKDLNRAGLLYKTQSGYVQPSPLISIVNQSMEIVRKHLLEFGLTPASRSRLSTVEEPADPTQSAMAGFLKGRASA